MRNSQLRQCAYAPQPPLDNEHLSRGLVCHEIISELFELIATSFSLAIYVGRVTEVHTGVLAVSCVLSDLGKRLLLRILPLTYVKFG